MGVQQMNTTERASHKPRFLRYLAYAFLLLLILITLLLWQTPPSDPALSARLAGRALWPATDAGGD